MNDTLNKLRLEIIQTKEELSLVEPEYRRLLNRLHDLKAEHSRIDRELALTDGRFQVCKCKAPSEAKELKAKTGKAIKTSPKPVTLDELNIMMSSLSFSESERLMDILRLRVKEAENKQI